MTPSTLARSWIASANGHSDVPLQNLPVGVFSLAGSTPRSGVAIGDHILDLEAGLAAGLKARQDGLLGEGFAKRRHQSVIDR